MSIERQADMDGDDHSIDDEEEVAAQAGGQEGVAQAEEPQAVDSERGYQALLAKQEARIKELAGQVAEAAKSAEVADALRGELQPVKARRPMSASPSRQTWRRSQP